MKLLILLLAIAGIWYAYQAQWIAVPGIIATKAVYRFQDEHGQWHFSDTAPADTAERLNIPRQENRLPTTLTQDQRPAVTTLPPGLGLIDQVISYFQTLGNATGVIEQAKQLRQQTQQDGTEP